MSDLSDIEELLSAYRRAEHKGKAKPFLFLLLGIVGTAASGGFSAHAYLSHLATKADAAALESHLQEVERRLDEMQYGQSPAESEQNRRTEDAQTCCNQLAKSFEAHVRGKR